MSLPLTLLNASNRRLRDEIETLTTDAADKQRLCDEYANVIRLLKSNYKHIKKEIDATQKEVNTTTAEFEKVQSSLLSLEVQNEGDRRLQSKLVGEEEALQGSLARYEALVEHQRGVVQAALGEALLLEEMVKQKIEDSSVVEKAGEKLKKSQMIDTAMFSNIWIKLQSAEEDVRQGEEALKTALEEHQSLLKELDSIQRSLTSSVRDQRDSLRAIESIHAESKVIDEAILANAAIMKDIQVEVSQQQEAKKQAMLCLEKLQEERRHLQASCAASRQQFDRKVFAMRGVVEELVEQLRSRNSVKRIRKIQKQRCNALQAQVDNSTVLLNERAEVLQGMRTYEELLKAFMSSCLVDDASTPSAHRLQVALVSFQKRLEQLEYRSHRTQEKLNNAVHLFSMEGKCAEDVNSQILVLQQQKFAQETEFQSYQKELLRVREAQQFVLTQIEDASRMLHKMQEDASEQTRQQVESLRAKAVSLEEKLRNEVKKGYDLRAASTSCRGHLRHTIKMYLTSQETATAVNDSQRLMEQEVEVIEKDLQQLKSQAEALIVQQSATEITHNMLKTSAEALVENICETASFNEILRGRMVAEEAQVEAEKQRWLVALHLEQNSLSAVKEDHRRLTKQRELVIMRYKESMESLSRLAGGGEVEPFLTVNNEETLVTPEVLHARYLLQQSCEREQLLQRGNILDQRIVVLNKEVEGLKKIHATMEKSSSRGGPKVAIGVQETLRQDEHSYLEGEMNVLEERTAERGQLIVEEISLLCDTAKRLDSQKREVNLQLREMTAKLKELKVVKQQKRLELSKLRDTKIRMGRVKNSVHGLSCPR